MAGKLRQYLSVSGGALLLGARYCGRRDRRGLWRGARPLPNRVLRELPFPDLPV